MSTPTVCFETLGCKLNYAETATLAATLAEQGVATATEADVPDVCVVNTCSVTALADAKCRQQIRKLIKRYPEALIVVTGCYAQLRSDDIAAIDGVDIVLGNEQKSALATYVVAALRQRGIIDGSTSLDTQSPPTAHGFSSCSGNLSVEVTPWQQIRRFVPSCERGSRTRYWLKVQDGCNCFCTYCTIPMARGRSRSGTIASITAQARAVAAEGGREIVLTGVNIGDFGKPAGESLIDLLRALDEVDGIERYRISSLEPDLLTDEIIGFVASSRRFMPHFHIPLQAGSDEVLRLMRRRYDTAFFADRIARCRSALPDCFIGVDVMVGSRGETAELFERSLEFVASLDVQHLHVFPYSERPGTAALSIPVIVPQSEKQQRAARMIALSADKERDFARRFIGTARPVLVEHGSPRAKRLTGYTDNYLRVGLPRSLAQHAGSIIDVDLTADNILINQSTPPQ